MQKTSSKFYPWLVISFCSLFLFYKYILQVSPSVMPDELMHVFHVSGAGLGNLAATYFYSYLLVQLFAGYLLDKYSPRFLTAFAIAIGAVGAIFFADTSSLWAAGFSRALIGAGAAFATVSYMKAVSIWFEPRQFATVGGLLATAAMIGALCGEAPLALLIHHVGWRNSLFYCGFGGIVLAVLYLLLVKDKKNIVTEKSSNTFSVKDILLVVTNRDNWLLAFYSALAFVPITIFGGLWGNAFLREAYHLSMPQAASLTSCVFLGLAFGSPLLGHLSDRLGQRFPVMIYSLVASLVAICLALYISNLSFLLMGILLFVFGFGIGSFMLSFTVAKERNNIALAGSVVALINTGEAIFSSISEPLTGKLLDIFCDHKTVNGVNHFSAQDYRLALSILPLYILSALAILWFLKSQNEAAKVNWVKQNAPQEVN